MSSPFKKVLLVGASTGIGRGMAEKLVQEGSFVVATSRSEAGLKELVSHLGTDKSTYMVVDITDFESISGFVERAFKQHTDIDCVWINAGVQNPGMPTSGKIDTKKVQQEVDVNYTGQVALSEAVVPYLKDKKSALIFTSTALAYLPFPMVCTYSATKAATHFYTMCLREQLKRAGSQCKVMELYPPIVQTELHGPQGRHMGMPVDEYIKIAWPGVRDLKEHDVQGRSLAPEDFFDAVEMTRINTLTTAIDNFKSPS